ncbi:MAG: radical SAM family heme chaperone HemW [Clostridiales bacterium]|nr:radical SAM family heme chaperone HemW [Clostridiales bacterium]
MTRTNNLGLYVHVPFCVRKCAYCDFLSFACREEAVLTEYAKALSRDIALKGELKPYRTTDTVYIGGGTPSLLSPADINLIMESVYYNFNVADDAEITIEANPATLNEEKLRAYRAAGINRISIGVQSFDNTVLNRLGRIHDKNDALNAIRLAQKAGFDNISIDLMFAIPGQTEKMWRDTVRQAIFTGVSHISLYSLQIEENTPMWDMVEAGTITPTEAEADREMYHMALDMMRGAGYYQYEISNAAVPGRESRHNLKYWSYQEYIGAGTGASSFVDGRRYCNYSKMLTYLDAVKKGRPTGDAEQADEFSTREEMGIYVFTGLRKVAGIDMRDFEEVFGMDFFSVYDPEIIRKYKGYMEYDGSVLKLTEAGMDISNRIMSEFV